MAFPIFCGKGGKTWSTARNSYSLAHNGIQTLAAFYAKLLRKTPYGFCGSWRG
jgi:hypothetical protein